MVTPQYGMHSITQNQQRNLDQLVNAGEGRAQFKREFGWLRSAFRPYGLLVESVCTMVSSLKPMKVS